MTKTHLYTARNTWTGNTGKGTSNYKEYERCHEISIPGKQTIHASSDPNFRGDPNKYNPEELLVGSLSGCHMLWYLHFCAVNKVVVVSYVDDAEGTMIEHEDGSGEFTSATLRPRVTVTQNEMVERARELHEQAHKFCFIARSVNFEVIIEPEILVA